ncbi:MAG: hypothetical protein GXO39_00130 [Thermotogae bacterium]|nr:hypothetical protein [Thermotogota bacterium]
MYPKRLSDLIEELLYGEDGYYTRYVRIGKRGDFFTAPHASPLFGYTVGRFLQREGVKILLEVGGGEGYLAEDILKSTDITVLSYERSPHLLKFQWKRLKKWGERWRTVGELVEADAYLLNEVLDAFPSNRYVFKNGRWYEVVVDEGKFALIPSEGPKHYLGPVKEGFVYDEGVGMEGFLKEIFKKTDRVLIFDYGYDEEEFPLLAPDGTLQGYRFHRVVHGLDALTERGDITHFINFTQIKNIARKNGFKAKIYIDQTNFLLKNGLLEVFESLPDDEKKRLAPGMKTLILLFRNHRVLYLTR